MDVASECVLVSIALSAEVNVMSSSSVATGAVISLLSVLAAVSILLGPGDSVMKDSSVACAPPGVGEPDRS